MENIVSEKFKDLKNYSSIHKNQFINAKPFPYIEIKNFFDEKYLESILIVFQK